MKEKIDRLVAWIGVYNKNGEWLTIGGKPLSSVGYAHWFIDGGNLQPNSLNKCVELFYFFKQGMIHYDCRFEMSYICESNFPRTK